MEERLIEQAIADALAPKEAKTTIRKKAYQARYEISRYDQNEFAEERDELQFGPTIITTRRNFFLLHCPAYTTAGDYLDEDNDAQPDIIPALERFRDTNDPSEYIRVLRNRAVGADYKTGSIDLINLIRLDGRFSVTNQVVSPCFSATNEDEFVFETLVGVDPNQPEARLLTAKPEQTENILLAGSTVFPPNSWQTLNEDKNIFWDDAAKDFVDHAETALWINLIPDYLVPGDDDVRRQGTVYFQSCAQFSYFQ